MGNFWKASHLSVGLSGAAVRSGEIPAQAREGARPLARRPVVFCAFFTKPPAGVIDFLVHE